MYNRLSRSDTNAALQQPLYYYRDSNGAEVDFLIIRDGTILPLEVKKSDSPKAADLSAVRSIPTAPTDTVLPGIVLCTAQTAFPLSSAAHAFPISAL
ncbi:MAG: DUF4143 domain-containing protein [Akkermansia sp.]|nr:DUF4143 domain-containing protein [Akkermansia sp.]